MNEFPNLQLGLTRYPGCESGLGRALEQLQTIYSEGQSVLTADIGNLEAMTEDLSSDQRDKDSLDRIASNMQTIARSLIDLGPVLEDPVVDEDHDEICATVDVNATTAHLVALVLYIFPKCNRTVASGIARALQQTWQQLHEPKQNDVKTETFVASNNKAMTLAESLMKDSALGTSIMSGSSYAETIKEYVGGSEDKFSIQLPQLPEAGKQGRSFLCETCQSTVRIKDERTWK